MRHVITPLLFFFCLLMTACGGNVDSAAAETPPATEPAPTIAPAFEPAAEALANGEGVAKTGSLMMQRFNAVSDAKTGALDMEASKSFVYLAEQLANKFPKDTLAALPLYRAAEVVRAMNDPKKAAAIYERVHNSYPNFSKAAESLFMLAFTYDEDLNNMDKAKTTYEKFLKLYPTNSFADDTQMLLSNLGKSDEEILKELEEKAKMQQ